MAEKEYIMTIDEVRKCLNISKNTLYNLLRSGELKGFKIGRDWKISRSAVDEYIRKGMNKNKSIG